MGILRFILAIAVVVYHSFKIFDLRMCGGQVAVESFYMISGFYMALILNEKYIGKGHYKKFILSRLYRIFPVYWIVLASALLLSLIGYIAFDKPYYLYRYITNQSCLSVSTIVYFVFENIVIVGQDILYFMKLDEHCTPQLVYNVFSFKHSGFQYLFVPQAWSISIELMFYALAPFIVTKKIKWQVLILALSIGLKLYCAQEHYLYFDPWSYRFFPFELGYFVAGSLGYHYYKSVSHKHIKPIYGYVLLSIFIVAIFLYSKFNTNDYITSTVFYMMFAMALPFIFISFKDIKWDRAIGELSFSIYIGHHIIVSLFRGYFFENTTLIPYYGYSVVICSLLVALVLDRVVVKPIETMRQKKFS